jgi:hypothetical protein
MDLDVSAYSQNNLSEVLFEEKDNSKLKINS